MNQFQCSNAALYVNDGTKISDDATAADIFNEVFYDPYSQTGDIHSQVLGTIYDDLGLLIYAMEGDDDCDVELWQRVVLRVRSRLKIAKALSERFKAAEESKREPAPTDQGSAIPATSTPWFVPAGPDGKPDFSKAVQATPKDMASRGWVWRNNFLDAVRAILLVPANASKVVQEDVGEPESTPRPSGVYAFSSTEDASVGVAE